MSTESWALWELMGSTDGRTRGRMSKMVAQLPTRGCELALKLSSVGPDSHWPHAMALWRIPDDEALARWLDCGFEDGVPEDAFIWGKSKLYSKLRGAIRPGHTAFLMEYVSTEQPAALAALSGPDLILSERLTPWQGLAFWGADDLFALAEREFGDLTCAGKPGVRDATGWWTVLTPDRDIV